MVARLNKRLTEKYDWRVKMPSLEVMFKHQTCLAESSDLKTIFRPLVCVSFMQLFNISAVIQHFMQLFNISCYALQCSLTTYYAAKTLTRIISLKQLTFYWLTTKQRHSHFVLVFSEPIKLNVLDARRNR